MRQWTDEEMTIIEEMRADKKSWAQIADFFGVNREALRSIFRFRKNGVENPEGTDPEEPQETTSFEQGHDFINVVCASRRMLTEKDVIEHFKIDPDIWEIERFRVRTSEGYRKDRKVKWKVTDGRVTEGDVNDSGKMLVVPLYHIEVRLIKRVKVAQAKDAISLLMEDAAKFAPKYPTLRRRSTPGGMMYEISVPDIHFGKLTWDEETGENYDIKIAKKIILATVERLLNYVTGLKVNKILLPLGNDFFNVDNKENTTVHGTPQQEDTRWQKTFRMGREVCVQMIDMCASVANVDVMIIPGNHDEQRSFYLGDSLDCWYRNNKNVSINNSPAPRKYYLYGLNLIGFTHGYYEKLDRLPFVMPHEVPDLWAKSKYREWHTGDKHHKKDVLYYANEGSGMLVRILRSLSATDAWHFNKGYVGPLRAAEAFGWHPNEGLVAQYTATAEDGLVRTTRSG